MSIHIQCCGIAIVLILMFFQGRQRKTHLLIERVFRFVVRMSLVCLLLDVGSILVINYAFTPGRHLPMLLVDLVSKAYLLTLPAMGVSTLLYICADIYYDSPEKLRRRAVLYGIVGLAGMVLILSLPITYHQNGSGVVTNTDGPSVFATYYLIAFYLILIAFHLLWDRDHLNHRRRTAVIAWMLLWVGSFLIQVLNNAMLLAGFACSMGILIVYLSLENPEANLDKQTGLLRRDVLMSYLRQMYTKGKDFSALVLIFDRAQESRLGRKNVQAVRMDLTRYLETQWGWMVFKADEEKLFLIFDTPGQAQAAKDQITAYMDQRWQSRDIPPAKFKWLVMPSAQTAEGADELLLIMEEAAQRCIPSDDQLLVDAQLVQEVRRDKKLEHLLSAAMAEDRIEIFYQPIYSIPLRRITGAEALVRIRDEEGRLVPPGLFIPIAESNGMILRLGKMIFEHVCRFIREHPLEELGLTHIDVNLSVVQCGYADLAMDYVDIMRRYSIDPTQINLEITESASTDEKNILLKNMDKLIDYGVSFALDDFGTGQSNLNYIMDMPVEVAKFDRGMTQAYFVNEKARQVMNAAVRMIHDMGLKIVSEGVETHEECQVIEALGIEYIQGFYFSKPLPAQEFLDYLKNFQPPVPAPNPRLLCLKPAAPPEGGRKK